MLSHSIPIFYMNDVSRAIITLIVEYNRLSVEVGGNLKVAYTYEAGPNAVNYKPKENVKETIILIVKCFLQADGFKDSLGLFGTAGVGEGMKQGLQRWGNC
jgi:diphosphomevalonate decarboxylase